MARFGCHFIAAAVAVLTCIYSAGAETNAWRSPVAIGASHRFAAAGMTSPENVSLITSAEETAAKVESFVGLAIPFAKGESIQMLAHWATNDPGGRVIRAQGWVDRALSQKLIIVNPDRADQEDILEGLCWLLINRYVIHRQDFDQKSSSLGAVPDWLSVGVAQNLYLALRTRNNQVAIRHWIRNEAPSFSRIMTFESLPEGRWAEKAYCALAADWMASKPDRASAFESLFSRLARGDRITTNFMGVLLTGVESGRELEKGWDLWIAAQTQVRQYWGGVSADRLAALRQLLAAAPDEMGIPDGEGVPAALTLNDLTRYRDAPWLPLYAMRLNLHIRGLGIGEAQEFRDVLDLYGDFLEELTRPRRKLGPLPLFRASPARLNAMLEAADKARTDLESSLDRKTHYVTGMEAAVSGGIVVPASVSNTVADMDRFLPSAAQ